MENLKMQIKEGKSLVCQRRHAEEIQHVTAGWTSNLTGDQYIFNILVVFEIKSMRTL